MIMRKFLFSFLIFLILTPSLACAMPVCAPEKQQQIIHEHCTDGFVSYQAREKTQNGKVKFLLDCMGVDMQKADTASIDKPDLKTDFVVYVLATDIVTSQITHTDADSIRGPPPDWPSAPETQPSLILTTQRFRI